MTKKYDDVIKAFGKDIEEASKKLSAKKKGFLVLHPEFNEADLHYDADTFVKEDGSVGAWAKLYQVVEVDDEPVANHPQIAPKKGNKRKPKVA